MSEKLKKFNEVKNLTVDFGPTMFFKNTVKTGRQVQRRV